MKSFILELTFSIKKYFPFSSTVQCSCIYMLTVRWTFIPTIIRTKRLSRASEAWQSCESETLHWAVNQPSRTAARRRAAVTRPPASCASGSHTRSPIHKGTHARRSRHQTDCKRITPGRDAGLEGAVRRERTATGPQTEPLWPAALACCVLERRF